MSDWAPVETMTELARYVGSAAVGIADPDAERPAREVDPASTLSVRTSAPNRSACSRKRTISSGPMTPSGKPGKFSTSVVSMSWPPGWSLVDEGSPSSTSGARLARAV